MNPPRGEFVQGSETVRGDGCQTIGGDENASAQMDRVGVHCRRGHGHEGIGIEHLRIKEPGMSKAQLLSTLHDFPGIRRSRNSNTKIHAVSPARRALQRYGKRMRAGKPALRTRRQFSLTRREKWDITLAMETPTSTPSHSGARERWITTALLGLGLITFAIDASNTQLCLPQIMTTMRVDLYEIHWILTAPGIARTVVIASMGWLTGLWGPRTLYLISIGSMTLGSLGTMLAWDWPSLIVFRILAGVGGGMIPQLAQAIFYQIFPPGQRGMALGFALMGWSIGPAFGPLMGGNLLESPPGAPSTR